jgi:D-3-phosphoglycerate dehydrogenase
VDKAMKPLNECCVLVTPTSFAKYDKNQSDELERAVKEVVYNKAGKPLTVDELLPIIGDFDGMIAGLDYIDSKVIENAKNLKVISRYGVGFDRIDLEAARNAGIYVTNTPGANSVSVAELTVGLAVSLARFIPYANNETKKGGWPRLSGIALYKKVFGLVGLGDIGQKVALLLKPFNCKIIAHRRNPDYEFAEKHGVTFLPLDDLLSESDFVSLHVPVTPLTEKMVNKEFIGKMKQGSFLINTSRGELVDEKALLDSLVKGHLRGAALDVFSKEPPDANNPLLQLPNIIVTPHMGAGTDFSANEMGRMAMSDCLAVLRGEKPQHIVVDPYIDFK